MFSSLLCKAGLLDYRRMDRPRAGSLRERVRMRRRDKRTPSPKRRNTICEIRELPGCKKQLQDATQGYCNVYISPSDAALRQFVEDIKVLFLMR